MSGPKGHQVEVIIRDTTSKTLEGIEVTLTTTPATTILPTAATTDAEGKAVFEVRSSKATSIVVSATADLDGQFVILDDKPTLTFATPGISGLMFVDPPTTALAGQAATPIAVRAVNMFGELFQIDGLTVQLSVEPAAIAPLTATTAGGIAVFNQLTLTEVGSYQLTASSTGLTGATTTFNILPGAATSVIWLDGPINAVAGAPLTAASAAPLRVALQDDYGNVAWNSSTSITLAIGTQGAGRTATLGGTTTVLTDDGVATFDDMTLNVAKTGYTLVATALEISGDYPSSSFNVAAGAATKLSFAVAPTNGFLSTTLAPISVAILDANDNTTASTANVTLALGTDPSGSASLTGTTTVAAVSGTATFSNVAISGSGQGFTLQASSSGVSGVTSPTFNIAGGVLSQLSFSVQPADARAAMPLPVAVTVQLRDQLGNLTTSNQTVSLSLSSSNGAVLLGTTAASGTGSDIVFRYLSIDRPTTGATLQASVSGVTGATSNTFNVTTNPVTLAGVDPTGSGFANMTRYATYSGTPANHHVARSVSGDGRYVVFESAPTGATGAIYLYDSTIGTSRKIADGGQYPSISADGTKISYISGSQIYLSKYSSGTDTWAATLITKNGSSAACNGTSRSARISGNGRYVVFESTATDLSGVTPTPPGTRQIYRYDDNTSTYDKISQNATGYASADCYHPDISDDGARIVFSTTAQLAGTDANTYADVYLWTGPQTLTRLSIPSSESGGTPSNNNPAISGNGVYAAWDSNVNALVSGDVNGQRDIFVRNLDTQTTTLVSRPYNYSAGINGPNAGSGCEVPSLSYDGRFVTFQTQSQGMVPADTAAVRDVFIYDTQNQKIARVGNGADGSAPTAAQADAVISRDGRIIVLNTTSTYSGITDTNAASDVYRFVNPFIACAPSSEACDGVDNDCDGVIDEQAATGCSTRYRDDDGDDYGQTGSTLCLCNNASPYVATVGGDCDDNPAVCGAACFPTNTAQDVCNGRNEDCDGQTDEDGASTLWYRDLDNDNYGVTGATTLGCNPGTGWAAQAGDCNDDPMAGGASCYPGNPQPEGCDGLDNNCDGQVDEGGAATTWYEDIDHDGYGKTDVTQASCADPGTDWVAQGGDCDDGTGGSACGASCYPGNLAADGCDGFDNDCDSQTDEDGNILWYTDSDYDGLGSAVGPTMLACTAGSGFSQSSTDCDDTLNTCTSDCVADADSDGVVDCVESYCGTTAASGSVCAVVTTLAELNAAIAAANTSTSNDYIFISTGITVPSGSTITTLNGASPGVTQIRQRPGTLIDASAHVTTSQLIRSSSQGNIFDGIRFITYDQAGIRFDRSGTIMNSEIVGFSRQGVYINITSTGDTGTMLVKDNLITNSNETVCATNLTANNRGGVLVATDNAPTTIIVGNRIASTPCDGIHVNATAASVSDVFIDHNTFNDTRYGIHVFSTFTGAGNLCVRNNLMSNARSPGGAAVRCQIDCSTLWDTSATCTSALPVGGNGPEYTNYKYLTAPSGADFLGTGSVPTGFFAAAPNPAYTSTTGLCLGTGALVNLGVDLGYDRNSTQGGNYNGSAPEPGAREAGTPYCAAP